MMDGPFQERFALLVESGQANERSVAAARKALLMVEDHYGIRLDEETGASLACHLAITMKRVLEKQPLSPAPDVVWNELSDQPQELALAASIVSELEKLLECQIAQDEVGFIAVHLCVIKGRISNTISRIEP